MTRNIIDQVNIGTMKKSVEDYARCRQLTPAEQAALSSIDLARDIAIVDLGVGGGRTVEPLLAISPDYIGLDYVGEMVDACREQFPGVRFEQADARDLSLLEDASADLVFFSMNGLCMVDHASRLRILQEVHRVLRPGGFFLFSSYNRDSGVYRKRFRFPDFSPSRNPLKLAVRSLRFLHHCGLGAWNRLRYRRHEIHADEYALINDRCHHYATLLYYISVEQQIRQLRAAGFGEEIACFDLDGRPLESASPHDSIFYVAVKA